jgi:hypothetical protein
MYDDRADVTDTSYKVLDKEFLDYFNIQVPPPTVNQVQNNNGQSNGQTIGVITSATTTQSGETGFINYQGYMNGFLLSTQNYFTTIFNKNKEVVSQYNNAVRQVWNKERNYTNGAFLINKSNKTKLFGKPKNVEQSVDKILLVAQNFSTQFSQKEILRMCARPYLNSIKDKHWSNQIDFCLDPSKTSILFHLDSL